MKKISIILIAVIIVMAGCAAKTGIKQNESVSFTAGYSSILLDSAKEETTEFSTTQPTTVERSTTTPETTAVTTTVKSKPTTNPPTTQKQTTTKQHTTTQKQTTTKPSTTRATTAQEETITKKPTTTKAATCTENGNHSQACGNMGKWFDSKSDVKAYVDTEMKYWADLEESGKITREEYYKKCPSGYECWSCAYCGKWTGNFKY